MKTIALISTGGTIEKTYDELTGILDNQISVLDYMLSRLILEGVRLTRVRLMNVDSLQMTHDDHAAITHEVAQRSEDHDGILITHGTDRLAFTGDCLHAAGLGQRVPVVLTGAMRPWEMRYTDALQNLTEALMAVQLLPAGVYVAMHNQVLAFPGVAKDSSRARFVKV